MIIISLKITYLKFHWNLPGVNELIHDDFYKAVWCHWARMNKLIVA